MQLAHTTAVEDMDPVRVALKELRRLFGEFADDFYMEGMLDQLRHFHALRWNEQKGYAEVLLPSEDPVPLVALGDLHSEQQGGVDVFYVEHLRLDSEFVQIPSTTAIGYGRLRELHDFACKDLDVKGWVVDLEAERVDGTEFDPADIAAFNKACNESGIGSALWQAIEDYPVSPNAQLFVWNDVRREPEVCLLTRRRRLVRVPVNDLTTVRHIPGTLYGRAWHRGLQKRFIVPDFPTVMALCYLLGLRSAAFLMQEDIDRGWAVEYRPPSPAESVASQDSAPGSPERASATFSTSSTAATSKTEDYETAPAAAGATAMDVDDSVDDPALSYKENNDLPGTSTVALSLHGEPVDDDQAILHGAAAH